MRNVPVRLTAIVRFQVSRATSSLRSNWPTPAQLTRTWGRPNAPATSATTLRTDAWSLTSTARAWARPPASVIRRTVASAASARMSSTATCAPSPPRRTAVASPRPDPPPVTIATLPTKRGADSSPPGLTPLRPDCCPCRWPPSSSCCPPSVHGLAAGVTRVYPSVLLGTGGPAGARPGDQRRGMVAAKSKSWDAKRGHRSNIPPSPLADAAPRSIHSRSPHGGSSSKAPGIRLATFSEVTLG